MNSNNIRASDKDAASSDSFRPDADPDEWIEQLSGPYRERPWAVVRELFQNASDAISTTSNADIKMIEFAVIGKNTKSQEGNYHLVIRDSGHGLDDISFCKYVGILGVGSKKGDPTSIGQFGVGFYSTQAICIEVSLVSRKKDQSNYIGWKYIPSLKKFFRLSESELLKLLSQDFENHPLESRKRSHGTSVYLNIDFEHHPLCEDWLTTEILLRNVRRDFFILSAPIYFSDYSENPRGKSILDINNTDISNVQLNLDSAPWEMEKAEQKGAASQLLKSQLPYTKEEDFPREWSTFCKQVGNGSVSGFLYLVNGANEGIISLCLKRMWVETARDCQPSVCQPIFGVLNFQPHEKDFDIRITPQRDHIVRDLVFDKGRLVIEDACIDFFVEQGDTLLRQLQSAAQQSSDLNSILETCSKILRSSTFFSIFAGDDVSYHSLLTDVPLMIRGIIGDDNCINALSKSAQNFIKRCLRGSDISFAEATRALEALQEIADRHAKEQRGSANRSPISWNPRATRRFLELAGKFFPVTLAIRERRKDGGFNLRTIETPLAGLPIFDPSSINGIDVLLKGNAEDYLSRNRDKNSIIVPFFGSRTLEERESIILILAILDGLHLSQTPKLRFVEFSKELFQEIATKENWISLIECFDKIVNGLHNEDPIKPRIEIDVLGYQGESIIPLLFLDDGNKPKLVINAYNRLMQDIQAAYTNSTQLNDEESKALISGICHELYHHAILLDLVSEKLEPHQVMTRSEVYSGFLSILQKYNDLRG